MRLSKLPREIQLEILDKISYRDLPRVTTGFMPQTFWLWALKSERLSWLWDIDVALIDAKVNEPCPSGEDYEWNWELLVRQLSRGVDFGIGRDSPEGWNPNAVDTERAQGAETVAANWKMDTYYDDLKYVPPGLVNRRRIWQLAEELFVGDAIPEAGMYAEFVQWGPKWTIKEYIQLPWSKSGLILNQPKWLPTFELKQYFRRVGGGAYVGAGVKIPLQWWQDPGGYWRFHNYDLPPHGPMRKTCYWDVQFPSAAPPESVEEELRKLRYPV